MSSDRFRHPREKAAYLAGFEDARADMGDAPKPLSREAIEAMSQHEINDNWDAVQSALKGGLKSEEELEDA